MATNKNFKGIIALTDEQYETLKTTGSVEIEGKTYNYSPEDTMYVTPSNLDAEVEAVKQDVSKNTEDISTLNTKANDVSTKLDDKASLTEENTFTGKQNFNSEVAFSGISEHSQDVKLTDSQIVLIDTNKDIVTKISADKLTINENGEIRSRQVDLPKGSGTLLTNEDISISHSQLKNSDTNTDKIDEWKITDSDAKAKITLNTEIDNTEISIERNYVSLKTSDSTGSGAEVTVSANSSIMEAISEDGATSLRVSSDGATVNNKDIITSSGGTFENRPKVKTNGEEIEVSLKSDLESYIPTQSENGTHYSQVNNQNGEFSVYISKLGETADLHNLIINKDGVFITGKVSVQGDADVSGTVTVKETETLKVKDNLLITNSDGTTLIDLSGIGIRKNTNDTYGIVYDPAMDSVKLGMGAISSSGKFTFNDGEGQPIALRADSSLMVNDRLVKWNANKKRFEDCGKDVSEEPTSSSIPVRTADGFLKSNKLGIDSFTQAEKSSFITTVEDVKDYTSMQLESKANKNDPILQFTQDAQHRTVSDAEKEAWNNKATSEDLSSKLSKNMFNTYVGNNDACSDTDGNFGQCSNIYNNDGSFYASRKFLFNKDDFSQEGTDDNKKYSLADDVVRTDNMNTALSGYVPKKTASTGEVKVYCISGDNGEDVCRVSMTGEASSIVQYSQSGQINVAQDPENANSVTRKSWVEGKLDGKVDKTDISLEHSKFQNVDTTDDNVDEWRVTDSNSEAIIQMKAGSDESYSLVRVSKDSVGIASMDTNNSKAVGIELVNNEDIQIFSFKEGESTIVDVAPWGVTINDKDIITSEGGVFENRPKVDIKGNEVEVAVVQDIPTFTYDETTKTLTIRTGS